jgi:hypothetical protein
MGKVSEEARKQYSDKVAEYKKTIEGLLSREKTILDAVSKDPPGAAFMKLSLADDMLNLVSYYLLLNSLSVALLGVKNEDSLNDARKAIYKVIIYIEDIVGNYIDVPYSDYEERLRAIETFDEEKRYALIRKIGFAIKCIEDAYGDNSKWKWSFVEVEGRFATIAKNILDLKLASANMDPSSPLYETMKYHVMLIKKLFQSSADRYREKYELSTLRVDDFKLAISYLCALKRIEMLVGDRDEVEGLKKKIDIWSQKMEGDLKKKEAEKSKI